MGGEPLSSGSSPKTYTEIFESVCPFYLSIGMTYEQFWYERADMAKAYRQAHELRTRQRNQELWLQGMYFAHALNCTVGNMFSKKSAKKISYPDEPFPISEQEIRERKEQQAKQKMERMKANFMAKAMSINANIGVRKE